MSMNANDLCTIQECMIGYRRLIEWMPALNELELELKSDRINTINRIMNLCGDELMKISEEYRKEV